MPTVAPPNHGRDMLLRFERLGTLYNEAKHSRAEICAALKITPGYYNELLRMAQAAGYLVIRTNPKTLERVQLVVGQMIELYNQGLTYDEIAGKVNVDTTTVQRQMKMALAEGTIQPRARAKLQNGDKKRPGADVRVGRPTSAKGVPEEIKEPPPPPVVLALSPYTGPELAYSLIEDPMPAARQGLTCEWITSSGRPWRCCGAPAQRRHGRPLYCLQHQVIATPAAARIAQVAEAA